ncbi:putative amidohydrolase [Constrictibacter sp. MBR-5]|uniref:carbon-nitrogen hydrolase family protein n=1 Tax=Constrictibacter sp. MBR-5 TaxID=3156467 RepID=UPI0033942669
MSGRWRVAAAQYAITRPADWAAYAAKQHAVAADAVRSGASLLVLPEYGSMELVGLLAEADSADLHRQIDAMQGLLPAYLDLQQEIARRHGLYVLASSFPVRAEDGSFRNRAYLHGPDGGHGSQDKLQMTRFEAERWGIAAGSGIRLFDTALGRIAVAVCYDAEFPMLVRAMAEAGADVVLVPSCTDTLAGYWRVRVAAQARALENQCFVVQSPTVGDAPWSAAVDENHGAAGIFGPPDREVTGDGVIAVGGMNRPGLVVAELDLELLARARAYGEVFVRRDWDRQPDILAAGTESVTVA